MRKLFSTAVLFITILCTSPNLFSQKQDIYINPGIKLGYSFGEKGGFTYGFELSVTSTIQSNDPMFSYGAVFDIDFNKHWTKIHFGAQASAFLLGLDIGPCFLIENGHTAVGVCMIPFIGGFLYPYYNYLYFGEDVPYMQEVGTYMKLSNLISGERYRIHM